MSPVEAVARAICESVGPEGSSDVRSPMGDWPSWQDSKPQARAAIEAFAANVTPEMIEAFHNAMEPHTDGEGWHYDRAIAAAIRAALSEPGKGA